MFVLRDYRPKFCEFAFGMIRIQSRDEETMSKKVSNVAIIVAMHVVRILYIGLGLELMVTV